MRKITSTADHRGFTLLEITIVIIILTILTSAAIPALTQGFLNKAENKVSLDVNAIEDAALAYYVKNNSWPSSITPTGVTPATDLESNGFLPTGWNALNPFGYSYIPSVSGSTFTVSTQVVNGSQTAIINQLPTSSYTGGIVSSSVPIPGASTNPGFGPLNCSLGSSGTALTDGYVLANGIFHGSNLYVYGYINGNLVLSNSTISSSGGDTRYASITMPVAKGENWSASSNGGSFQVCWRPYG